MTIYERIALVKEFGRQIDSTLTFAYHKHEDFCTNTELKKIYYNLRVDSLKATSGFWESLINDHEFECDYPILFALLHEIGHNECGVDDTPLESLFRIMIEDGMTEGYEDSWIEEAYYNMPSEWEATEWAIDFWKKHRKFCEKYGKLIG